MKFLIINVTLTLGFFSCQKFPTKTEIITKIDVTAIYARTTGQVSITE